MPSAGGLAIFLSFGISIFFLLPLIVPAQPLEITKHGAGKGPEVIIGSFLQYAWPFLLAAAIVVITGLIDDIKEISPRWKLLGLTLAASLVWFLSHARLDNLKIPFGGPLLIFPPWLSFIFTVFWILAITNAINLIDGLDGLATGISMISLATMAVVAKFILPSLNIFLPVIILILLAACAGFLPYNFNPAIIYLGDTGALFLGFMIAVFSLQGLKNATAVAVMTPLFILAIPLTDTITAMIRRRLNRQKISSADKMHLHHRLLALGFSHRGAVLTVYAIASIFALISLMLQVSSRLGGIALLIACLLGISLLFDLLGVFGEDRHPIMNILQFLGSQEYRAMILDKRKTKKKRKHKHGKS